MANKRLIAFQIDAALRERLTAEMARSGRDASKVVREALRNALSFDPVIEKVISQMMLVLNRERSDIVECLLIRQIAQDMAKMAVKPDQPLILDWAAAGADGAPLRGKTLFNFLYDRFRSLLSGKEPPESNIQIISMGPAAQTETEAQMPLELPVGAGK